MSDEQNITYTAFATEKREGSELLNVLDLYQGDWISCVEAVRNKMVQLYESIIATGVDVNDMPLNVLGLRSQTYNSFILNGWGAYFGITVGGLVAADVLVQRELVLDHQRLGMANTIVHELNKVLFVPRRMFYVNDVTVEADEIVIKRGHGQPPFIEDK